jgi:hypothetical protein
MQKCVFLTVVEKGCFESLCYGYGIANTGILPEILFPQLYHVATYSTMIQLSETRDLRVSYIFQIPKESVVQENLYIQSTT